MKRPTPNAPMVTLDEGGSAAGRPTPNGQQSASNSCSDVAFKFQKQSTPRNIGRWALSIGRWAFCLVLLLLCSCKPAPKPLTKLYQLPPFTLTERSGQQFDSATMRGKVWVASFFFASCPGPCNALNEQMKAIHQGNTGVHLLSISTDVDDTPQVLAAYAKARNADARWLFLTGKKDEVFDLSTKGFKLALADSPSVNIAEKFIHSTKIALIDQQGWIRGYYDGFGDNAPADVARLLADIKRVQEEH